MHCVLVTSLQKVKIIKLIAQILPQAYNFPSTDVDTSFNAHQTT